jgi:O-antigen/teichoic acid export membrane protein
MRRRFRDMGTEAAWVVGGQIGVAAGSLLGIKVLTHILTPREYGRFSIAGTIALMVGIGFFTPLGQGLMRHWSIAKERGRLEGFARVADKYLAAVTALTVLLALLAPAVLALTPWSAWGLLSGLCILAGGIAGAGNVRTFVLTAIRKRKPVAVVSTAAAVARPLAGAAVAGLLAYTADAVMAGTLLAAVAVYLLIEAIYRKVLSAEKRTTPRPSPPSAQQTAQMGKEILTFAWPFLIWGLFSWTHQFCDRWSLMAFHGADVVGAFAVIGQLALYPLIFGANFLSTYFTPIAYERGGDPETAGSLKPAGRVLVLMTGIYAAGAAALIVVFALCHAPLVLLVSNPRYTAYSPLLPWLTLAWALYYLGHLLSNFGLLANRPRIYMGPVVVSALIAAGACWILSAAAGPSGVVAGLAAAGAVYAAWCLAICIRLFHHPSDAVAQGDS